MDNKVRMTDDEWRAQLSDEQYRIAREGGTERAFTGAYWNEKSDGTYRCACCGHPVFASSSKFESSTGWPSFTQPINGRCVSTKADDRLGMVRTEVQCSRCDAHLGHVFDDGPQPTGMRYCLNSCALRLTKD